MKNNRQIHFECDAENAERVADLLSEHGALAVSFQSAEDRPVFQLEPDETPLWDKVTVLAIFEPDTNIQAHMHEIEGALNLKPIAFHEEPVPDEDWVRLTQEQFQPQCFGNALWVIPAINANDTDITKHADDKVLLLDPGLAFGTGTHPTTALCLEWLATHPPKGLEVIDYGCGSGILSLAALTLGAKKVWAIDHDDQAIIATHNNAALNDFVNKANLIAAKPEALPSIQVPLLVANILANPLIELEPLFRRLCTSGATLVLSGIMVDEIDRITSAYGKHFEFTEAFTHDEWACLTLTSH